MSAALIFFSLLFGFPCFFGFSRTSLLFECFPFFLGRTPTGACNNAPFSEGLSEGFSRLLSRRLQEGFLEGVLQWALMGRRVLRRVLRRGSKKGLSRRHLEGRSTPFREYDPVGVRPTCQGFRGSEEPENPCFFGGFPCLFPKKQGKEDQATSKRNLRK